MTYFSDQEHGERPRDIDENIDDNTWGAIRVLIAARIDDGSFGASYPETCSDPESAAIGTDAEAFAAAMSGEVLTPGHLPPWFARSERPDTITILDLIVFCWRTVGKPIQGNYHSYGHHHHLTFDREVGRAAFRNDINRILARNSLAYQLTEDGSIERLAPPVLREELASVIFRSGDAALDQMLESARRKFLDRDPEVRLESLEKLWDAWERLKTLGTGANKKEQADNLLDRAAGQVSPLSREAIGAEALELTRLGNTLRIRHSEINKEPISHSQSSHVDQLFHRLLAVFLLLNRQSLRIQNPKSADRISVASTFWPRPAGSRRRP